MSGERIILEFVALPADVPAPIRVRHLLKRALRAYRLECVRVIDLPPDPATTHQPAQALADDAEAAGGASEREAAQEAEK